MLKRFLYASAAILCLTLAYHFGAASAQSRPTTNSASSIAYLGGASSLALTAVGDVYRSDDGGTTWRFSGNLYGATTPTGP
jgi:hypothetical protein